MPLIVYYSNLSPQKYDTAIDWQLSFAKKYKEYGCDYIWLVFSSRFDDFFKTLKKEGLNIEIIPAEYTSGFRLVTFLLKFIFSMKVDVFHMHFIYIWHAILLIILSKLLLSKTIFIHHKRSPGKIILSRLNIKKYISPLSILSLLVDKIVCNSDSIVDNCLNRSVNKKKTFRIYNGIRINRFEDIQDVGKIKLEFNIPCNHRIITIIKDARPEVGLKDLLLSIPKVIAIFQEVVFLIVGGGVETKTLRVLAKQLKIENNVIFTGIRNDIPQIIAESYFTIDPSPVEAFGNVIIESMAGRKPVIAVNAWGPKEIIVNGRTGILVEPGDPTDFAPAIIDLLSSPERVKEMAEKSYERVNKFFTVEHMVDMTVKLTVQYL
jgi:glycosyltransferase involved in cell wall biosynthesis